MTAQLVLPAELSAVSTARRRVGDQVARCVTACSGPSDEDIVELLTSEAVAHAVRHGTGPVTVDVLCAREHVCIVVTGTSPAVPVVRQVGPEATGGRGMALIDHLATRWGLDLASPPTAGKTVWFQLTSS